MPMIKYLKLNKCKAISLIFLGVLSVLFIVRLTYDVVLGDESFYLGMADRILKGDLPFYEMYEPTQSSVFLIVPLLAIYKGIVGSLDGGILFLRLVYFLFCLIVGIWIYGFVNKRINKRKKVLFIVFTVLFYAPFSLYCVSYNTLADLFLASFAVCIWGILYNKKEAQKATYFGAGVIAALVALSYPTLVIFCFLMIPVLSLIAFLNRKSIKGALFQILSYCLGGGSVAIAIAVFLSIYVGRSKLLEGIKIILADPLYTVQSKNSLLNRIFLNIADLFSSVLIKSGLIYLIGLIFIVSIFKKKFPTIFWLIMVIPIYNLIYVFSGPVIESMRVIQFIAMTTCALPVVFPFVKENKIVAGQLYSASVIPSLIGYIVVCSSSAGSGVQSSHIFFGTFIGTCGMYFLAIEENIKYSKKNIIYNKLQFLIWVFPVSLFLVFGLSTYSKNPICDMHVTVSSGIYKNIKTNKETKNQIDFIQQNLKNVNKKNETVLILPNGYALYPMLKMKVCAPTTWGLYSYWYPSNESVFVNFYERFQQKPDKVIIYYNEKIYGFDLWEAWYPIMMKQFLIDNYRLVWTQKTTDGSVIAIYDKVS